VTAWLIAAGLAGEIAVTVAVFAVAAHWAPEMHDFWWLYVLCLLAGYALIIGLLLFAAFWWTRGT
jgi:hypothetical protein